MRTIAGPSLESMLASETEDAYIALLTIAHETGTERFTSDSVDTVIAPDTWVPYPFKVLLPTMEEGVISEGAISLTNVDRQLIDEIRSQATPMTVQIDVARSSDLNIVASFQEFKLRNITYSETEIAGKLTMEDFLAEPIPKDLMSGRFFPGLFFR